MIAHHVITYSHVGVCDNWILLLEVSVHKGTEE